MENKNPISVLNEISNKNKAKFKFEINPCDGEFLCVIYKDGIYLSKGMGRKKQDAKAKAAEAALEIIVGSPVVKDELRDCHNHVKSEVISKEDTNDSEGTTQTYNKLGENDSRSVKSHTSNDYEDYIENLYRRLDMSYDDMIDIQIVKDDLKLVENELRYEGIDTLIPIGSLKLDIMCKNYLSLDYLAIVPNITKDLIKNL